MLEVHAQNIFTDGVHDQKSLETTAVESQNLTMQGPDKGRKKAISKYCFWAEFFYEFQSISQSKYNMQCQS